MKKFLFFALFALFCSQNLSAHQVLTEKIGTNKFELKFWAHGEFEKYKPDQIIFARAFDKDLKQIKTGINYHFGEDKTAEILTQSEPAIVASGFNAGFWVESDMGGSFNESGKIGTKGVIFGAAKSIKLGKTYFSWSENLISPVGLKLEIIALSNPLELKIGDFLPVLVLKNGKPAANLGFEVNKDESDIKTNEQGIARIKITQNGLNIIAAIDEENELNSDKFDTLYIQSSISFIIK